jgi:flagellar assembly protein FliH
MILRNVQIAVERHRLGFPEAHSQSVPAPLPNPPSLTLATVGAWLANECDATRLACAELLAPELSALRAAANEEGRAAGEAAAIGEVQARHAAALAQLTTLATAVEASSAQTDEKLAGACAVIVAEAFAKLAGEALLTPAAALGAVRSVISRARAARRYTIHVHPRDLPGLEAQRSDLQMALGTAVLDLQADPTLRSGGCRLQSELGTLDANFEVQLRGLFDTLQAAHTQRTVAP